MEISNIVANEKIAAELAEVYIANIYGKHVAERQKPYSVTEIEDYWQVKGVMQKLQLGGTFEIHIAKKDGKILVLKHSRQPQPITTLITTMIDDAMKGQYVIAHQGKLVSAENPPTASSRLEKEKYAPLRSFLIQHNSSNTEFLNRSTKDM